MVDIIKLGIVLAVSVLLVSLFSSFIPQLEFLSPSIGLLFVVVIISVLLVFKTFQKDFKFSRKDDLIGLVIVISIIGLLLVLGLGGLDSLIGGDFFSASVTELQSIVGVS